MNILVTNDDGYSAPGLLILKQALEKVGSVTVVAPSRCPCPERNNLSVCVPFSSRGRAYCT